MDTSSSPGIAHFLAQSDAVGHALLVALIGMSALSWALIAVKGVSQWVRGRRSRQFLNFFWNARSLDEVAGEIATHGARDPFSHLAAHAMHAQAHHARYGAAKLEEAGTAQDFVTRTLKKVLDEETTRLENGLTALATIGATAPFVGLFGTVIGILNAFNSIAEQGNATLATVAAPVGNALFATAAGLFAAIPAVVAYNSFVSRIKVFDTEMANFSADFLNIIKRHFFR